MRIDDIKSLVCDEIDRQGDRIISLAKDILRNPEPGFQEFGTPLAGSAAFRGAPPLPLFPNFLVARVLAEY